MLNELMKTDEKKLQGKAVCIFTMQYTLKHFKWCPFIQIFLIKTLMLK